jgi:hypothetical protein
MHSDDAAIIARFQEWLALPDADKARPEWHSFIGCPGCPVCQPPAYTVFQLGHMSRTQLLALYLETPGIYAKGLDLGAVSNETLITAILENQS